MNGIFERELRELFADGKAFASPEFSGAACTGVAGEYRIRVQFAATETESHYDALRIIPLKNDNGFVAEPHMIRFDTVMDKTPGPERRKSKEHVTPYIRERGGDTEWYPRRPSPEERERLVRAAGKYLDRFRKPEDRLFSRPAMIYISVPLDGGGKENIDLARQITQEVQASGNIPVCPRLLFPYLSGPNSDGTARSVSLRLLEACDQMMVYGSPWSKETWTEVRFAKRKGIPVTAFPERKPETAGGIYDGKGV